MTITNQQIETVLRTYDKQLRIERINQNSENKKAQSAEDLVNISLAGKMKQLASEPVEIQDSKGQIEETSPNKEKD